MDKFSPEALLSLIALVSAGIGLYVRLELQSIRQKHDSLQAEMLDKHNYYEKQFDMLKEDQKDRGEWIEKKMDLFMEKFEVMNEKINDFIKEFSKVIK